ncbi:MAG: S-layer homology domain-containing protein [Chloroflexi bacterium]|nr:S-layer homology domain-containing protein [Chloroflexota bacterium]
MKNKSSLFVLILSLMAMAGSPALPQSGEVGSGRYEFTGKFLDVTSDETIFDNGVWWISKGTGPLVQYPMAVFVNGVDKGTTFLLKFGHRVGDTWPEITAIYNTGYIRSVPPGLPYGTGFTLGPAYWGSDEIYVHNVQISRIDIDTTGTTPYGSIKLTIRARDFHSSRWPSYRLDITYNAILSDPAIDATQMAVTESFSVASGFSLSISRQASREGFKWVQLSSMYINTTQHDSDSAVYVDSNESIHYSRFSDVGCNNSIYTLPEVLSSLNPWVEARHNDNLGWQGNTPNTIIFVNSAGLVGQATIQGYITCTSDPNDDNVGVWINYDSAPLSFNTGDTGNINYTLISQDDPKEPPLTFADVSLSHWAWDWIERLYAVGITGGCATNPLRYCPENSVTRAQMAIFLERGIHGSSFAPPTVSPSFNDTAGHWAEDWIEALYSDGITAGCGGGNYCPDASTTRAQMAVFLLRSKHGAGYTPPPAGGTMFSDVSVNHWAGAWIEQLAIEGITGGCATNLYCPEDPVTRAQMAVFLVRTFNLP